MKTRALRSAVCGAAVLAGAAAAGPARAADVSVKAPAAVAPATPSPPPDFDAWSGVFAGIEDGHGWGRQRFDAGAFPGLNLDSIPANGGVNGGFAGAQKQSGSRVLGIEADFDGTSMRGSSTSSGRLKAGNGAAAPRAGR